jgi:leucine dehydrogenase
MALSLKSLMEQWSGVATVVRYDQETGTWIFIALHSDVLGPASGGTRMKVYSSAAAGLRDAQRLAEGMTFKWAAVDFDIGGGKAVLAVPRALKGKEREGLLRRYGRLLASLKGAFSTGVDLGTSAADMQIIGEETEYVHGLDRERGVSIDPGPFTAHGVFVGIRAALAHVYGSPSLEGRVVHVQGVGGVGRPLARLLREAGAHLILSDVDSKRAEALAAELGGMETLEPHTAYEARCHVYAPCAVGGTLNAETIPELKCRVVAGSANNQLDSLEDADRLHERGILYAPDYIVNAGGALALGLMSRGVKDRDQILDRVSQIEGSLGEILEDARSRNESPVHAARRVVERRLQDR